MQDNSGYKNNETTRALVDAIRRAQASDYSRKPARPVDIADIIAMFFTGVLFTLLCAIALGSL